MDRVTGRQIAAARALAGITQAQLADEARISIPTLKRMEASQGAAAGMANNVDAVVRALKARAIEFEVSDDKIGVSTGEFQRELDI